MGLLLDAAIAWNNLHDTTYELLLGRKSKCDPMVTLSFMPEDFSHLAGIQYADDVDFSLSRAELHGKKFMDKLLRREVDDWIIEKAAEWEHRIRSRLEGLICLEQTLDDEFSIYRYNQRNVPHGSTIPAQYVIKSEVTGVTFFVFIDKGAGRWFCRSIFRPDATDYTINQARMTVLQKCKIRNGETVIDYTHPHYRINGPV